MLRNAPGVTVEVLDPVNAESIARAFGLDARWGLVGLTFSGSLAAWVEFLLLRHRLNRRLGTTGLPAPFFLNWRAPRWRALSGLLAPWSRPPLPAEKGP